jgi:hypothetical protein
MEDVDLSDSAPRTKPEEPSSPEAKQETPEASAIPSTLMIEINSMSLVVDLISCRGEVCTSDSLSEYGDETVSSDWQKY